MDNDLIDSYSYESHEDFLLSSLSPGSSPLLFGGESPDPQGELTPPRFYITNHNSDQREEDKPSRSRSPSQENHGSSSLVLLNSDHQTSPQPSEISKKRPREKSIETSDSDEDSTESEKSSRKKSKKERRQHCKVPLPIIIRQCLENPAQYKVSIKWIKEKETFAIQWRTFCRAYRFIGKSNAKNPNIMNRFGRFKIKKTNDIPPVGYDIVYNMGEWYYNKNEQRPEVPVEAELEQMQQQESTSIEDYLALVKKLPHTAIDLDNIRELLLNETNRSDMISKYQLWIFHKRFGPFNQLVPKIRNFIHSNAVAWYHGSICRDEAESRIIEFTQRTGRTCFLLRAAQTNPNSQPTNPNSQFLGADTLQYVFALSFLCPDNKIRHIRLYSNRVNQLVQCIQYPDRKFLEKPVLNFWQLFCNKGDPVNPKIGLNLRLENISTVPDTEPWSNSDAGYIPN